MDTLKQLCSRKRTRVVARRFYAVPVECERVRRLGRKLGRRERSALETREECLAQGMDPVDICLLWKRF